MSRPPPPTSLAAPSSFLCSRDNTDPASSSHIHMDPGQLALHWHSQQQGPGALSAAPRQTARGTAWLSLVPVPCLVTGHPSPAAAYLLQEVGDLQSPMSLHSLCPPGTRAWLLAHSLGGSHPAAPNRPVGPARAAAWLGGALGPVAWHLPPPLCKAVFE